MPAECSKCRTTIRGETGIRCSGVCNKVYHCATKCSGLDQYSIGILENKNFIRFMCDDCVQYIHNVDLIIREIQDGVDKNKQNLAEYKNEFKNALSENEHEIKKLLEAIEKRYEERLKKIDNAQKLTEKSIKEFQKLCVCVNDFEHKQKEICNSIEVNNNKMCEEIKTVIKQTTLNKNKQSYAETLKNKTVMPEITKKVPLIIKPKERQEVEKTRKELNEKVDPANLKISSVENRKSGTIIIQAENYEEREKIKVAVENQMSTNYEIKVPKPVDMSIIVTDMTFELADNELIAKIKKQNPHVCESNLKIVKTYSIRKDSRSIYCAKIKVDFETYKKIMEQRRINIGWERCRVFDGTEILQCFKCKGYNHRAKECKNQETCIKCHGNHRHQDCDKERMKKCINCVQMNKKLNLNLDENHDTMSRKCSVYQNKLSIKQRRLGVSF